MLWQALHYYCNHYHFEQDFTIVCSPKGSPTVLPTSFTAASKAILLTPPRARARFSNYLYGCIKVAIIAKAAGAYLHIFTASDNFHRIMPLTNDYTLPWLLPWFLLNRLKCQTLSFKKNRLFFTSLYYSLLLAFTIARSQGISVIQSSKWASSSAPSSSSLCK